MTTTSAAINLRDERDFFRNRKCLSFKLLRKVSKCRV